MITVFITGVILSCINIVKYANALLDHLKIHHIIILHNTVHSQLGWKKNLFYEGGFKDQLIKYQYLLQKLKS